MNRPGLAAFLIALAIILVVGVLTVIGQLSWSQTPASLSLVVVVAFVAVLGIVALVAIGYFLASLANKDEALGLPAGSVRALIALLIIVMFAVMAFYFAQTVRTRPTDNVQKATQKTDGTAKQKTNEAVEAAAATDTTVTSVTGGSTGSAGGVTNGTPSGTDSPTGNQTAINAADSGPLDDVNDLAKLVLQTLGALMTTIIGFYFGSKSATDTTTKTAHAITEAIMASRRE